MPETREGKEPGFYLLHTYLNAEETTLFKRLRYWAFEIVLTEDGTLTVENCQINCQIQAYLGCYNYVGLEIITVVRSKYLKNGYTILARLPDHVPPPSDA